MVVSVQQGRKMVAQGNRPTFDDWTGGNKQAVSTQNHAFPASTMSVTAYSGTVQTMRVPHQSDL
jgi:hypothetical protein